MNMHTIHQVSAGHSARPTSVAHAYRCSKFDHRHITPGVSFVGTLTSSRGCNSETVICGQQDSGVQQLERVSENSHQQAPDPSGAPHPRAYRRAKAAWDISSRVLMLVAAMAVVAVSRPDQLASHGTTPTLWQFFYCHVTLVGVFASDREVEGVILYGAGAVCYWLALAKLHLFGALAGHLFLPISVACICGFHLSIARLTHAAGSTARLWQLWHDLLGLLGCAGLAQAVWCSFVSAGCSSLWPAMLGMMAGSLLLAADRQGRPVVLEGAWHAVPAWCATLLFMTEPAADLANGVGSAPLTLSAILGIASLALQIPRSLWLRNRMFFTGTSFCSAAGCLFLRRHSQLLSLAAMLYAAGLLAWAMMSQYHRALRQECRVRADMV